MDSSFLITSRVVAPMIGITAGGGARTRPTGRRKFTCRNATAASYESPCFRVRSWMSAVDRAGMASAAAFSEPQSRSSTAKDRRKESGLTNPSRTHPTMCTVWGMDETVPLVQARSDLGNLVNRVRHGRETILISDYGTPAVAMIPVDELAELRRLRDQADIADAEARKAASGPVVAHEAFMAELETEDRQAAAS
ncbi:hypothetical protein DMH25_35580 [Streptomyces sp. WAC 01325]|nr:hypothetical protein DMH25_35580 [Streptomyces sp. WAC 01325]